MTDHSDRWQRVAAAVKVRMKERGFLSDTSLAKAAKLSQPTLHGILSGSPRGAPRESSLAKLCRALWWSDESIEAILEGGTAITFEDLLDQVTSRLNQIAFDGSAERGETVSLQKAADRLRVDMGQPPIYAPYVPTVDDIVKGALVDHDRAVATRQPVDDPIAALQALVREQGQQLSALIARVEEQGVAIGQLARRWPSGETGSP